MKSALLFLGEIEARLSKRNAAVFLDYDGTLTPIVSRPDLAVLQPSTRAAVEALARVSTVAIVSGRARSDVEKLVGLPDIIYAGSHGFDIKGPAATGLDVTIGDEYRTAIQSALGCLQTKLGSMKGVIIEDKIYSIAIHFREASGESLPVIDRAVSKALETSSSLRRTGGKMIYEIRPNMKWDKGEAVLHLLEKLEVPGDTVPIYLGDDETDTDAFRALTGIGLSIYVGEDDRIDADYRLANPEEVSLFISKLASILDTARRV